MNKILMVLILVGLSSCSLMKKEPEKSQASLSSQLPSFILSQKMTLRAMMNVKAGCLAAGMQSERMVQAIVESQGKVCEQVIGDVASRAVEGREICTIQDEKCMFMLGYVKTHMMLGNSVSSESELNELAAKINETYAQIKGN